MKIVDVTVDEVLADHAEEARSMWGRFRGLMLRGDLPDGSGLVIRPCGSIHMMFMRFPIDAVFFDEDLRVTKVARRVPKWRGLSFGGRGTKGVIELPSGSAVAVEPGHQLDFAA